MWLGKNDQTLRWVSQHPSQSTFLWQNVYPPQAKSWWTLACRHHWTHKDVTSLHRVVHDNCHYKQKEKLKMCTLERDQWPAVWVGSSVAEVTSYLDILFKGNCFISFWVYEVLNLSPFSPSFCRAYMPNYFFTKHFSIKTSQRHFQLPTASDAASYTWAENVMIIKIERNHSHFKPTNTLGEISSVLLLVK